MPEQLIDSPNLDITFTSALQLSEQAALEPMQLIAVADRLGQARRYADVVHLYQCWLSHCSSNADYIVQFNLGVTFSQLEQLPAAEAAYRAAIMRKPDFAQAWFNLGAVIERQGRADNALVIWQSMLDHPLVGPELNPELYIMLLNSMGRLMEEVRQLNSAEAKLLASLQADPQLARLTASALWESWTVIRMVVSAPMTAVSVRCVFGSMLIRMASVRTQNCSTCRLWALPASTWKPRRRAS
jgi:tetratricopeptide (TPR) repeat protein